MNDLGQPTNTVRHLVALGASVLAMIVVVEAPGGLLGYLGMAGVGLISVLISHAAIRRPGKFHWAAIVGLCLSYLALLVSVGLFMVRIMRILMGFA